MRYIIPILLVLLVVGGLAGMKGAQISVLLAAGRAAAKAGPPPESVSTALSRQMKWENSLSAVGTIVATQGVSVSTEVPGMVKRIRFESGDMVKRGELLVELDTSVERAQLKTALAEQQLAEQTFTRTSTLTEGGGLSRSQLDTDTARLDTARAEVLRLQAELRRKEVRAPFAGKLGIRALNLGQYLPAGATVTTLESLASVYVDFALPQQALPQVQAGLAVRVSIAGPTPYSSVGQISAVDPAVDDTTRTIRVRATLDNEQQALRPGMFATVSVLLPGKMEVVAVPATAIVHAPYGDSVFVVTAPEGERGERLTTSESSAKRVRQQFVRLGEQRGDFVAVLRGFDAGQEVVSEGAFKLRNGASVVVNNSVKPEPQLKPELENR